MTNTRLAFQSKMQLCCSVSPFHMHKHTERNWDAFCIIQGPVAERVVEPTMLYKNMLCSDQGNYKVVK